MAPQNDWLLYLLFCIYIFLLRGPAKELNDFQSVQLKASINVQDIDKYFECTGLFSGMLDFIFTTMACSIYGSCASAPFSCISHIISLSPWFKVDKDCTPFSNRAKTFQGILEVWHYARQFWTYNAPLTLLRVHLLSRFRTNYKTYGSLFFQESPGGESNEIYAP